MIELKSTFVIDYSTIVNIQQKHLREIATLFSPLTSRIRVRNDGDSNEEVLLFFEEEGYILSVNWKRIRYMKQGPHESYETGSGPISLFFRLVEETKGLEEFGEYESGAINQFLLLEEDDFRADSSDDFVDTYLSEGFAEAFGNVQDSGLTLIYSESGLFRQIRCGPFREKDISDFTLEPFGPIPPHLKEQDNLLVRTRVEIENVQEEHELFESLIDHKDQLLDKLDKVI